MRLRIGLVAAAIMVAAVGGTPAWANSAYQAFGAKGRPQDVRRTIDITMRDNAYQPRRIQVRAGETVRFRIRNEGELLHEFNIGTAAMHQQHQREMQAMFDSGMMTPTGLGHMDHSGMGHGGGAHGNMGQGGMAMAHDDPNAVLVEPGKTAELVFKFTKPAELEFACNIPGHYQSGMVGEVAFSK
ncbi:cupredoxin domain-containing protein [Roseomonas sp. E05]|uniref:cupredoxin domain-containing protein n=1 Tax=Roseomonas sp. E05 TaxID=3046310 RepID=UPI0032D97FE8